MREAVVALVPSLCILVVAAGLAKPLLMSYSTLLAAPVLHELVS
jgi:hypothetical protein